MVREIIRKTNRDFVKRSFKKSKLNNLKTISFQVERKLSKCVLCILNLYQCQFKLKLSLSLSFNQIKLVLFVILKLQKTNSLFSDMYIN